VAAEVARQAEATNRAVVQRQPQFQLDRLSRRRSIDWFAGQWGVNSEEFELAALDRGFASTEHFTAAARLLYLVTKFSPPLRDLALTVASDEVRPPWSAPSMEGHEKAMKGPAGSQERREPGVRPGGYASGHRR
jgi:hypothetical protein